MNRGRRGQFIAIVVLLAVATALGAAYWNATRPPRENHVQVQIDSELAKSRASSVVVDLSVAVGGDWTRAIIVCGGTRAELDSALGFHWDGPDPDDPGFLSMLVLADEHVVRDYFAAGQDDMYVNHWFFTLCTIPLDPGGDAVSDAIIAIPRSKAQIQFHAGSSGNDRFWYVPSKELLRLEGLGSG